MSAKKVDCICTVAHRETLKRGFFRWVVGDKEKREPGPYWRAIKKTGASKAAPIEEDNTDG